MKSSKKKLVKYSIKLIITILLGWAIYRQVFAGENLHNLLKAIIIRFQGTALLWLFSAAVLVFLNYALETLKFRQLTRTFSEMNFWQSFKSVLAGTTIAIFTPNRIGEYAGRVVFFQPEQGWRVVIATLVGSLSQLLIIFTFGIPSAVYFSFKYLHTEPIVHYTTLSIGLIFILILYFVFFNIDLVIPVARRIPKIYLIKKYLVHLKVLKEFGANHLGRVLLLAGLRFFTYSMQYYLLLRFFGVGVDLKTGFIGIASIFLVQSSIPLPPVTGLLARGEIAIFIWSIFGAASINILAATFLLFLINVVVPALAGLILIISSNFLLFDNVDKGKA